MRPHFKSSKLLAHFKSSQQCHSTVTSNLELWYFDMLNPDLNSCRLTLNPNQNCRDGNWCDMDIGILIPLSRTGPKMASVSLRVVQFHRRPRNWCWHSRIAMLRPCTTLGITSAKFLQNRSCFGTRPGIELHSTGGDATDEYWWPTANDLHRDHTHTLENIHQYPTAS